MDECDAAQLLEAREREAAIARALAARTEESMWIDGRRCCLECEEPILEARLKARPEAVRCAACQADHDRTA